MESGIQPATPPKGEFVYFLIIYITDDVDDLVRNALSPSKVSLSVKGYKAFNVLTGNPVGSRTALSYTAVPYYLTYRTKELSSARSSSKRWTLIMDYLFASDERDAGNEISLKVEANGRTISRSYRNIPLQKNFRTNLSGGILSENGVYRVEVEPAFAGEYRY